MTNAEAWDYAIGMIRVDGLEPTEDLKKYIEKEIQLYKHTSSEIDKLENAIIKTKGLYAILCVCDDYSKANTILQEYGFD